MTRVNIRSTGLWGTAFEPCLVGPGCVSRRLLTGPQIGEEALHGKTQDVTPLDPPVAAIQEQGGGLGIVLTERLQAAQVRRAYAARVLDFHRPEPELYL